jgi:uncharacterized membrane protein
VATDGERLATVEAVLRELRSDLVDLKGESVRTRTRLHNLEGIASAFMDAQRVNRRKEEQQYLRLGMRIQVLTVVVGLAAVLSPIVAVFLTGK